MIDRGHDLPLGRQAELLGLGRSTQYHEPRPIPAAKLAIMRRIDELHLDYPFAGSRMLRDLLRGEGVAIGRELVATLMPLEKRAPYFADLVHANHPHEPFRPARDRYMALDAHPCRRGRSRNIAPVMLPWAVALLTTLAAV
jgi:hypothetical protein